MFAPAATLPRLQSVGLGFFGGVDAREADPVLGLAGIAQADGVAISHAQNKTAQTFSLGLGTKCKQHNQKQFQPQGSG